MKNLIDYLVFSLKVHCIRKIIRDLNLPDDKLESIPSCYGYTHCLYYAGVKIHYNEQEYNTLISGNVIGVTSVLVHCSGKGCRTIESLNAGNWDWMEYLNQYHDLIIHKDAHIARIDIAIDDDDGILKMKQIARYAIKEQYVCKSKCESTIIQGREEAVYFGSPKSDRRLRIYNKAKEQRLAEDVHWIRCELQLRNDCATSYYLNYVQGAYKGRVGALAASELNSYLRFVQVPRGANMDDIRMQRHQTRLETARWWDHFLYDTEKIKQLHLPGNDYTFDVLRSYINQTRSSIKAYLELTHGDIGAYLDQVQEAQYNLKQKDLIYALLQKDKTQ